MKNMRVWQAVLVLLCLCGKSFGQTPLYDLTTIQDIRVYFSQPDWDYQMDTAKAGSDSYIMADSVVINGVLFDSVGVKYKGNSSYNSTYVKNPMHISLNEFKGQSYNGYKDIKLSNGYADPSLLREVLSYNMLKNYMDCPQSNFAKVYINGTYTGLYSNDENIGSRFLNERFYSSSNTFVKCNPVVTPSPTTKSNLRYLTGLDSTGYFNYYELKSTYGWNELVALCDSVTNHAGTLETVMDMDRVLWMLAFNSVMVNLDSYTGVFCQNYYLYKDNNGRFNPVVWDLNMCLGGFPYVGSGNSSMGSLTIANMQQLSPTFHSTDSYWPLIKDVMANARWKMMYIAHMRTIAAEMLSSGYYQTLESQLHTLIDSDVAADNNKFFTYSDFQNCMTQDVTNGSYQVPGITNLVAGRMTYLSGTTEFQQTPPAIGTVASSPVAPVVGAQLTVTASVTGSNYVYLGWRTAVSDIFSKTEMFDDGAHNDGSAGDGVYGAFVTASSTLMQFYVYAENSTAGAFSPARAEHEFYTVLPTVPTAAWHDVVFNEFMAKNNSTVTDANGEYEDWIELYNNSANDINLSTMYCSDSYTNPLMWKFPSGTHIPAHGLLTVWMDSDTTQLGLHANFKLSASGANLLLSYATGDFVDSLTFGPQSADISQFRCPDGTGSWSYTLTPTFGALNCPTAVDEMEATTVHVYPNPVVDEIHIEASTTIDQTELFNLSGERVLVATIGGSKSITIHATPLPDGVYLCRINGAGNPIRIVVQH